MSASADTYKDVVVPASPSSTSQRIVASARRNPVAVVAGAGAGVIGAVTALLVAAQPAAEAMAVIFKALGIQAGVAAVVGLSLVAVISWWQGQRGNARDELLREVIDTLRRQMDARDDRWSAVVEQLAGAVQEVRSGQRMILDEIRQLRDATGPQRRIDPARVAR